MKLSDHLGEWGVDSAETRKFVKHWFRRGELVLIALKCGSVWKFHAVEADELADSTDADLEALIRMDDKTWTIYFGVQPIRKDHKIERRPNGRYTRGGKEDVQTIRGMAIDFDLKDSGFNTLAEIHDFINSLPLKPSTVIENGGSGGVHAYWAIKDGEAAKPSILRRWWTLVDHLAGSRSVDYLVDSSRLMRLPGTQYVPKTSEGKYGVTRVKTLRDVSYTVDQIEALTETTYQKHRDTTTTTRAKVQNHDELAVETALALTGNRWERMFAMRKIEKMIEQMDWGNDILLPQGWTFHSEGELGKRHWARPGQHHRSGNTDYDGSTLMNLHSLAEETGLSDLAIADVPLTKYRVLLRIRYNDNVEALVTDLLRDRTYQT